MLYVYHKANLGDNLMFIEGYSTLHYRRGQANSNCYCSLLIRRLAHSSAAVMMPKINYSPSRRLPRSLAAAITGVPFPGHGLRIASTRRVHRPTRVAQLAAVGQGCNPYILRGGPCNPIPSFLKASAAVNRHRVSESHQCP